MTNNSTAPKSFPTCFYTLDFEPQPVASLLSTVVSTWIVTIVINGVSAPLLYINFLVICTILTDVRLRQANYNISIAILACADLFVGLVVQPIHMNLNILLLFDVSTICESIVALMVDSYCCAWSLASMTVISVERYLAIEHPFFYEAYVTVPKTMVVNLLSFVMMYCLLLVFCFIGDGSYAIRQISVAVVVSCCLVIIVSVGKVYRTARRHQREVAIQREGLSQQEQAREREKARTRLKEIKRYFTLGTILFSSVLLYFPSLLSRIIAVAVGRDFTPDFKYLSQFIWLTCGYLQSLANPLAVSLRLSYIRQGVKRRLVCNCK